MEYRCFRTTSPPTTPESTAHHDQHESADEHAAPARHPMATIPKIAAVMQPEQANARTATAANFLSAPFTGSSPSCERPLRQMLFRSQRAETSSALIVCMRFSDSSKTLEYFDSKTSSVTSRAPQSFVTSVSKSWNAGRQ